MAFLFEVGCPDLDMENEPAPFFGRARHADAALHGVDDVAGTLKAASLDTERSGGLVAGQHGHQYLRCRFFLHADSVVDHFEMQFDRLIVLFVPADLDHDVFALVGIVDRVAEQVRQKSGKLVTVPDHLGRDVLFHPVDDGNAFFLCIQRQDVRHVAQRIVEVERRRFQYHRFGSGECLYSA